MDGNAHRWILSHKINSCVRSLRGTTKTVANTISQRNVWWVPKCATVIRRAACPTHLSAAESLNVQLQREITERKQVEAALRESEQRYRSLFNSIDEGFCVIEKVGDGGGESLDFRYLQANPAFAAQSGMSNVFGNTIRQALPNEPEGWCVIYDTVLGTGEPIRFERALVSHGRVLELYVFRAGDEKHRRVGVIFKDITERRRAEAALRESEERFRTLFELGPVAV